MRYIYFSRRLYEVWATDDLVAFVVSHEIAHHDVGQASPGDASPAKSGQFPAVEDVCGGVGI